MENKNSYKPTKLIVVSNIVNNFNEENNKIFIRYCQRLNRLGYEVRVASMRNGMPYGEFITLAERIFNNGH